MSKNGCRWSPKLAFLLVSFCLGQLGDGLNIFQGIYLVGIGWNEGSVGAALSLMGLTALLVQPLAGDWVDKATIDRRVFLTVASIVTALSASTILLVRVGNTDHNLIYASKVMEGIASSFIGPCLAALTLASFGPDRFDSFMASNLFWGHVGSVVAAILAGIVAYFSFPDIKYCFLVIGASALLAISFIPSLPEGDPMMGRGFQGKATIEDDDYFQPLVDADKAPATETSKLSESPSSDTETTKLSEVSSDDDESVPMASSYLEVFLDPKTCILCLTGFFFQ
jgi:MFS family permease